MISSPPIADLASISIAGASLERALQRWTHESTGHYTLNVPILVEAVDFYTRLLAARKTIIKLSRLIPSRERRPEAPPFDDLAPLSAVGSALERVVMNWAREIEQVSNPDAPTLAEAIDIYTRLASARKTLIKLSRLTPPRPYRANGNSRTSDPSDSSDPVPAVDIPQLPTIPDIPYDQLRPELDFVAAALNQISPDISRDQRSDRSDRSDRSSDPSASSDLTVGPAPSPAIQESSAPSDSPAPQTSQTSIDSPSSHTSHSSHSSHDSPNPPDSSFHPSPLTLHHPRDG